MNATEIHAMPDEDLDAAIAEQVMGQRIERLRGHWWLTELRQFPQLYHESLDACHAAEERLKEMGLAEVYGNLLFKMARERCPAPRRPHGRASRPPWPGRHRFWLAYTPARERAEAILAAVQGKAGEGGKTNGALPK